MNQSWKFSAVCFATLLLQAWSAQAQQKDEFARKEPNAPHVHLKRGASRLRRPSSPLLKYAGGTVLHPVKAKAIFWGAPWANASFAGDKIAGIDQFFSGFSNSRYASTGTEYSDRTGRVPAQATYLGYSTDTSSPPNRAIKVSEAVAEACKITGNHPDASAAYFLYTSSTAGNANYCAWHSWGNCSNGAPVQVAYIPNLDGIAGCDPDDASTGHSEGLAAIANVTAHEFLETITDPRGSGWYDSAGEENGDKCAWSFPAGNGVSTFANNSQWKLQMEWSNSAYLAGSGMPNLSGQNGCIY